MGNFNKRNRFPGNEYGVLLEAVVYKHRHFASDHLLWIKSSN